MVVDKKKREVKCTVPGNSGRQRTRKAHFTLIIFVSVITRCSTHLMKKESMVRDSKSLMHKFFISSKQSYQTSCRSLEQGHLNFKGEDVPSFEVLVVSEQVEWERGNAHQWSQETNRDGAQTQETPDYFLMESDPVNRNCLEIISFEVDCSTEDSAKKKSLQEVLKINKRLG